MWRKGLKMQRDDTDIADFRQWQTVPATPATPVAGGRLHTGLVDQLPVMLAGGIMAAGVMVALAPAMPRTAATMAFATMTPGSASPAAVPAIAMAGGGIALASLLFIVLMLWGQAHHVRRHAGRFRAQRAAGRSDSRIGLHLLGVAGRSIAGALLLALALVPALHRIVRSGLPLADSLEPALKCALVLGGFALAVTLMAIPAHLKRLTAGSDALLQKEMSRAA
ncbi:MAG: hypothetical protein CFE37_10700 [Alphaproteobacteria bacterium PA4]|nr:MAG: hypothetical protein CFE37_10700 [Alphaproteobacteria bacterium PA4]